LLVRDRLVDPVLRAAEAGRLGRLGAQRTPMPGRVREQRASSAKAGSSLPSVEGRRDGPAAARRDPPGSAASAPPLAEHASARADVAADTAPDAEPGIAPLEEL